MMEPIDEQKLAAAVKRLEHQGLAMSIANKVGVPVDVLMKRLPRPVQSSIEKLVHGSLERCLRVALRGMRTEGAAAPSNQGHTALAAASGAVGGFFGLPGLAFELPLSTTLMLHSIAEIARSHGENLADPETALSCLHVFALGSKNKGNAVDSAYYATRTALAQATREAASYIAQKGLAKSGAPALVRLVSLVASRFGVEVAEKVAAQMVPLVGAAGGAALNVMFTTHFQTVAEGHFTVRELERSYGPEQVQIAYNRLAGLKA
jgi:hypothetical protein